MSAWSKTELEGFLEAVINELELSDSIIREHGALGTPVHVLVRMVLEEKDRRIQMLQAGMVDVQEIYKRKGMETATCTWKEDGDDQWLTGCCNVHEFTFGNPAENKHQFCPYCGETIAAVESRDEEDELRPSRTEPPTPCLVPVSTLDDGDSFIYEGVQYHVCNDVVGPKERRVPARAGVGGAVWLFGPATHVQLVRHID